MSVADFIESEKQSTENVIADWMVSYIANTLGVESSAISRQSPFTRLGLDSNVAVAMTGDLGEWLGVEIDPAAPYEHPTIDKLAAMLAAQPSVCAALAHSGAGAKSPAGAT